MSSYLKYLFEFYVLDSNQNHKLLPLSTDNNCWLMTYAIAKNLHRSSSKPLNISSNGNHITFTCSCTYHIPCSGKSISHEKVLGTRQISHIYGYISLHKIQMLNVTQASANKNHELFLCFFFSS